MCKSKILENRYRCFFLIILLFNIFSCMGASQTYDGIAGDTLTDVWGHRIVGKVLFENSDDGKDGACKCLLSGNNCDTIIIVRDLSSDDFSLGGPYEQTKDSVLYEKFSAYKERLSIMQDRMGLDLPETDYGPPYLFVVVIGNDTIEYQSDLKKQNYYGFSEAFLNDSLFTFAEFKVGGHINETSYGAYIPDSIVNKIKCVQLLPYNFFPKMPKQEYSPNKDWYMILYIDSGLIKRIHVYS